MKLVLTAQEMRDCDRYTIDTLGIPAIVLVENAARAIANSAVSRLRQHTESKIVICVCGTGNNGADGAACARILQGMGFDAAILPVGNPEHRSPEMTREMEIAGKCGVPECGEDALCGAGLVIDALLGTGLSRNVEGKYADVIDAVNRSGAYVISADIPSGIHSDTGAVMGCAVHADETVTMQFLKRGLCLYPGASYAGIVTTANVEIRTKKEVQHSAARTLTSEDERTLRNRRDPSGNKGTFGKVLIAAGSAEICGAALLSALAAFRCGCGMVKVVTAAENAPTLQQSLPEAMLGIYRNADEAEKVLTDSLPWADVVVCGPGIGTGAEGHILTETVLRKAKVPVILDADALNCLHGEPEKLVGPPVICITPHMGEMQRLTGTQIAELKKDPVRYASELAQKQGIICVLKDARTVTAHPDGSVYLNLNGNSGMATAGSGDVLTGIMAGIFAQGTETAIAPALACFVHARCGDAAKEKYGEAFMKAGDMIEELKTEGQEVRDDVR